MMNLILKMLRNVPPDAPLITVEARKFDNSVHRRWQVRLLEESIDWWILIGVFEEEINHPLLGVIRPGTISLEFYWKNRPYNIFRFHESTGELRNFYCNVNLPPVLQDNVLSYIDLDIDVLVQPDFTFQTLDLDEFAENAEKHRYSPLIMKTADEALAALIQLIEKREFPFNLKT